jgi:hypothetical protein
MTDANNETAGGASHSDAGLGCERLCVDFCNKFEEAQAEIRRLRAELKMWHDFGRALAQNEADDA